MRVLLHSATCPLSTSVRASDLPSSVLWPTVHSLLVADHDLRGGVRQPRPLRDTRLAQPLHLQDAEEERRAAAQNLHQNPQRVSEEKTIIQIPISRAFSNTRNMYH